MIFKYTLQILQQNNIIVTEKEVIKIISKLYSKTYVSFFLLIECLLASIQLIW